MSSLTHTHMKTLRYFALINIALTIGEFSFGATLASQVDARRSGGTATGTFVNNELPSFLLVPEPSTALLSAFALAFAIARRKR